MSILVLPTPAPRPKTKNARIVGMGVAGVLVILVVAQLFTFEELPRVLERMWLPGGVRMTLIVSAVIVVLEVIALPFLLSMLLSPAMRILSMIAGWLVTGFWLSITVWQNISGDIIANSGFLGATVSLPVHWGSVLIFLAVAVLVVWASWGMWPLAKGEKQ